jgi:hypothetical protein
MALSASFKEGVEHCSLCRFLNELSCLCVEMLSKYLLTFILAEGEFQASAIRIGVVHCLLSLPGRHYSSFCIYPTVTLNPAVLPEDTFRNRHTLE